MSLLWIMAAQAPYFHATDAEMHPGDSITPASEGAHPSPSEYPEGEKWRADRVWLARDPGNAGAWWGHDHPDTKVYEVMPSEDVRQHSPTDFDYDVSADYADDQHHASRATVVRKLHPSEWNDYHRHAGLK